MTALAEFKSVLEAYPAGLGLQRPEYLGSAGGLSGACLWRLDSLRGPVCLRRWPHEHPTAERLTLIHSVLQHVFEAGFTRVPVPVLSRQGKTFVRHAGHYWELARWMPGAADLTCPLGSVRLRGALAALAQFHRAAESYPIAYHGPGVSPGIGHRRGQLEQLLAGNLEQLAGAIRAEVWPAGVAVARRIVMLAAQGIVQVGKLLAAAAGQSVPIAPCLCDIWSAHVLFVEDDVTGLIDFGALKLENVAADVARLLGSVAGDDAGSWQLGLAAYQAIRPLSDSELLLVKAFDQSTVLIAGLNWIDWVYRQRRQFDDPQAILLRLEMFAARLACLLNVRSS